MGSRKSLLKESWGCHLQLAFSHSSRCSGSCSKLVSFPLSCVGMSPLEKCVEVTHSWLPYGLKHFFLLLLDARPLPHGTEVPLLAPSFLFLFSFCHGVGECSSTRQASALPLSSILHPGFLDSKFVTVLSLFCPAIPEGGVGECVCELAQ